MMTRGISKSGNSHECKLEITTVAATRAENTINLANILLIVNEIKVAAASKIAMQYEYFNRSIGLIIAPTMKNAANINPKTQRRKVMVLFIW